MNKRLMSEALRKSIAKSGIEVINKPQKLRAFLGDFLPGASNKVERMALLHALEIDEWNLLVKTAEKDASEHNRAIAVILPKLQSILGWTEERSVFVLECYINALGWDNVLFPCSQSAQNIQATQNSPNVQIHSTPVVPPRDIIVGDPNVIGNIISFGQYNGKPIEWRICKYRDGKNWAYVLSKDILLEIANYNEIRTPVTWETCTLRKWLNEDFLKNFTSQEQAIIGISTTENEDNQWFGVSGGNSTKDRVFIPSISEVIEFFGGNGQLKNKNSKFRYMIDDQYNSARIANYDKKPARWWLRLPGFRSDSAAFVYHSGCVNVTGHTVGYGCEYGVRPALWLNLKSFNFY
ncbi:hypothetical protein AGMMS49975_08210 [Clostridia bacterium]|nr:hypothetical protein AGMMS49975_08210 [Clostridia bacterium]